MSKTKRVLILKHLDRQSARGIIRGVTQYAGLYGPWIFLHRIPFYKIPQSGADQHYDQRDYPASLRALLESGRVDGLIAEMPTTAREAEIVPPGFPAVIIPVEEPVAGHINLIGETEQIGALAADYFLRLGFKHIAFFGYAPVYWSRLREHSFCQRLQAAGVQPFIINQPRQTSLLGWQEELDAICIQLQALPRPLAIWAWNDDMAESIVEACRILDIVVPDEVSVLGCDDDELICNLCLPPLSSIGMNFERAGYEMAELLDQQMKGLRPPIQSVTLLPTAIVERQSTEILAIEDREVARAVRFIRQNGYRPLQVEDVVAEIPLSRSVLYDRFRQILGRTIHQEIKRTRVETIAKALITTQTPIKQIAQNLGFDGEDHLARYFRAIKGVSPQMYRRQYGAK